MNEYGLYEVKVSYGSGTYCAEFAEDGWWFHDSRERCCELDPQAIVTIVGKWLGGWYPGGCRDVFTVKPPPTYKLPKKRKRNRCRWTCDRMARRRIML